MESIENVVNFNKDLWIYDFQEKIIQKFLLSYNLKIALHIDQLLVPQDNNSNSNMLLVEVHNPASFYLQYEENTMELKNLMNKMQ